MLRWQSAKATLPIVYYELRKGETIENSEFITNIDGLAFPQFETVGGLYKYWIIGVDSAGNRSEPQYTLSNVAQPPDYILKYDYNSSYDGIKMVRIKSMASYIYQSDEIHGQSILDPIISLLQNLKLIEVSRCTSSQ